MGWASQRPWGGETLGTEQDPPHLALVLSLGCRCGPCPSLPPQGQGLEQEGGRDSIAEERERAHEQEAPRRKHRCRGHSRGHRGHSPVTERNEVSGGNKSPRAGPPLGPRWPLGPQAGSHPLCSSPRLPGPPRPTAPTPPPGCLPAVSSARAQSLPPRAAGCRGGPLGRLAGACAASVGGAGPHGRGRGSAG